MIDALQHQADGASQLLTDIGNPHRLLILCQLVEGEKPVSDLVRLTGLSGSALSQHLARLRASGHIATRRDGRRIYYSLRSEPVRRIITVLHDLYCRPETGPTVVI